MQNAKCKIAIQNSKIIANRKINHRFYKVIIRVPEIARQAKPGQFLHIRINKSFEPLLRRPFSIHQIIGKDIGILYKVVGKGTQILSQKGVGEYLDVMGPLGNGFSINHQLSTINYVLVAGGIGVAPLFFLAEKLMERKPQVVDYKPLVLIGANTKDKILCEKEFKDLGCQVKISTDDGSRGFKGKVTDLLKDVLRVTSYELRVTIFACGPRPMLKEIAKITQHYKIPGQISLEENMGCGLGACLGCIIKTKDGYKRVCKDGPIFNADEIVWEN
jgi:dihydroorotate dehydrogenase electron transfer subunit